ncbi:MAG: LCP family protein [Candidatus Limnocylindria bacterium]
MIASRPSHASGAFVSTLLALGMIAGCSSQAAPAASPTATPSPSARPSPSPTPRPTPAPTPVPLDQGLLNRRLTVMVIGNDSNPDRASRGMFVRTDSIMVVSVNTTHTRISMVSLPRDTVDIPLGNGGVWRDKVNGIQTTLGVQAMKRAMAATLGVPIDYYVEVNMPDFGGIVSAVGGVDVVNPYPLYDPPLDLSLPAGRVHLDGNGAARYVRTRDQDSDFARAGRQQQVLLALVAKLVNPKTKSDLVALLSSLHSLRTDLPLAKLRTLREIAVRSGRAKVTRVVLAPPQFSFFAGIEPNSPRGWIIIPNIAAIQAYVRSVMTG